MQTVERQFADALLGVLRSRRGRGERLSKGWLMMDIRDGGVLVLWGRSGGFEERSVELSGAPEVVEDNGEFSGNGDDGSLLRGLSSSRDES